MLCPAFGWREGGQRPLPDAVSPVPSTQSKHYATVAGWGWQVLGPSLQDVTVVCLSTCSFSRQCQESEFYNYYFFYYSFDNHANFQHSLYIYIKYL